MTHFARGLSCHTRVIKLYRELQINWLHWNPKCIIEFALKLTINGIFRIFFFFACHCTLQRHWLILINTNFAAFHILSQYSLILDTMCIFVPKMHTDLPVPNGKFSFDYSLYFFQNKYSKIRNYTNLYYETFITCNYCDLKTVCRKKFIDLKHAYST